MFADPDEKTAKVVVPDYQLSLAIGKEGQNARLAARLTGYKIDIKSETQAKDAYGFRLEDYMDEYDEYDYEEDGEYEETEGEGYAQDGFYEEGYDEPRGEDEEFYGEDDADVYEDADPEQENIVSDDIVNEDAAYGDDAYDEGDSQEDIPDEYDDVREDEQTE